MVISAIGGTAGVGKTALAVHWAHRVADRFPDGQLYVNLRGYDPDQPVPAGRRAGRVPARARRARPGRSRPSVDERAARYRSLLAGRRMLVRAGQRPRRSSRSGRCCPARPDCLVRGDQPGRAGRAGRPGRRPPAGPGPAAARRRGRAAAGADRRARADADPAAAAALAAQCARLPLALRVAAELAAARPAAPLADLVGELADQQRRLDLLDAGGDPRTAVRAVFSWSYRHLDAAAARAFRLLGLHPGPDFDAVRRGRAGRHDRRRRAAGCWTSWPART